MDSSKPVAVVVGATSKWQADGRNTHLVHGGPVDDRDLPVGMRVGLFGSGGLSHEPGGKRYFFIDEAFDHWFLGLLEEGDHHKLLAEVTPQRMEQSGEGGTAELFAWFVVLGAIGAQPCSRLGYTAYSNFKCGVGAVRWELGAGAGAGRAAR